MNRRRFLQSLAIGTASAVGGCSGISTHIRPSVTVTGIETGYPSLDAAFYHVDAEDVDEPEDDPVPFESLSSSDRLALASAIHRERYWTDGSDFPLEGIHDAVFSYRGDLFKTRVGVADRFRAEDGPKYDPDWTDPVTLKAAVEGDELTITLTNDLDTDLAIHGYGRPYYGVLVAVNGTTAVLEHDAYETNEHIQTAGMTTTDPFSIERRIMETIATGESIQESYGIPDDLPAKSIIWFSVRIGDESIELFNNMVTIMTATITLET